MRTLLVISWTLIIGTAQAYALPIFNTKVGQPNGPTVEVSVAEAETQSDAQAAAKWANRDLEKSLESNSQLKPEFYVVEQDQSDQPRLIALPTNNLRKTELSWAANWLNNNYRVSFTIIRLLANAGVTTWGLILSPHISILSALPVGLIAGSMSAGFQYYNQGYQEWLLRSRTFLGRMGRTLLVNGVYMAVAKFVSLLTGIMPEHTLVDASSSILKTALLCTLAQGPWSLGVALGAKTQSYRYPERESQIKLISSFKTLALSMTATALSVANLMGMPLAEAAMVGMAGSGAVYYTVNFIKDRKWTSEKLKLQVQLKECESHLTQ